jgi:hypothetical protein
MGVLKRRDHVHVGAIRVRRTLAYLEGKSGPGKQRLKPLKDFVAEKGTGSNILINFDPVLVVRTES